MSEPHPTIRPQPGILDIALYQGGESRLEGHVRVLKLSSNENPLGPSPKAIEPTTKPPKPFISIPIPTTRLCAEPSPRSTASTLPASSAAPARTRSSPSSPRPTPAPARRSSTPSTASACTGSARWPPAPRRSKFRKTQRRTDVDAILAAANDRTALVFIANPNNPTGTMIPPARSPASPPACRRRRFSSSTAPMPNTSSEFNGHADLVEARDNVVMTRTFSKIHGLGGLRIGWGYGPAHVIDVLNRLRGPFNLSTPALVAAEAADPRYRLDRPLPRREHRATAPRLAAPWREIGIPSDPSRGELHPGPLPRPAEAEACDRALRDRRHHRPPRRRLQTPRSALRITVGDAEACARVAAVIADFARVRA